MATSLSLRLTVPALLTLSLAHASVDTSQESKHQQEERMVAVTLTVLTVLALLGFVSCQGGYGDGRQAPAPQPHAYPRTRPQPPVYPPITSKAPSHPPVSPSSPPPKIPQSSTYPPMSSNSPPPKTPQLPTYPSMSPSSPPPMTPTSPSPSRPVSPPPPTHPPPSLSPPPPMSPTPPAINPPTSPRPPIYMSPPIYSSPSPSPPPPLSSPPPINPPMSPSSPPHVSPPPPIYPSPSPSPPPPIFSQLHINPPTSPSPPLPVSPPPPTYPPSLSPPPPMSSPPPTNPPPSPSPPPVLPPSSDDSGKKLEVGYYNDKCGYNVDVEAIVRKHVSGFDAGMKAGLIRLFFHDCFVRGCDASILLDPTSDNQQPEKFGIPNFPSLRGYEVIDAAKAELEAECPGTVSCADIVAFAARDASFFLSNGGIGFAMPAGRYDGNVSLAGETLPNLPPPFAGLQQLEKMFADKGLDAFDMVTLSGAHSIGRSHCSSFRRDRLPPSATSDMDPDFAAELQANCTSASGGDNTVVEDYETPDVLDNQYYQNVLDRKVLFTSDAALTTKDMTNSLVRVYSMFPWLWNQKFEEAMVKMSRIEIKTAATGEIRKTCRVVNSRP